MEYVEMTTDEAIEVLKKSKGKKVLVAIQNLEKDETAMFCPRLKADCISLFENVKTTISVCDDFMQQLRLFTEYQRDIMNIESHGLQKTILIRWQNRTNVRILDWQMRTWVL